jgi:macrodomain Ter protein organizer (MatP/YcbG family)
MGTPELDPNIEGHHEISPLVLYGGYGRKAEKVIMIVDDDSVFAQSFGMELYHKLHGVKETKYPPSYTLRYPTPTAALSDVAFNIDYLGGSITTINKGAERKALKLIQKLSQGTAAEVFNVVFGIDLSEKERAKLSTFLKNDHLHAVMPKPSSQEDIEDFARHFGKTLVLSSHYPSILKRYFNSEEDVSTSKNQADLEYIAGDMMHTTDPTVIKRITRGIMKTISYFIEATTETLYRP